MCDCDKHKKGEVKGDHGVVKGSHKSSCGKCGSCKACQPCKCKKECHRKVKRVAQVNSNLRAVFQDPGVAAFVAEGGVISETIVQTNGAGNLLYDVNLEFPAVGMNVAALYQNNNGTLTLLESIPVDPFNSPAGSIDSGQASFDFTLFSVIDDDGSTDLRVRVFGVSDFSTPLFETTFSDFAALSGSGNGGWFTPDNKYLILNYISNVSGGVLKVLSVSAGLPVVASIPVPGFAFGGAPQTIGNNTYIALGYSGIANFTAPVPIPPFGFIVFKFDESAVALTIAATSPTMYAQPVIDNIILEDGVTIRYVVGLPAYSSFVNAGLPDPAIPVLSIAPGTQFTDTNNVQIFDLNTSSGNLSQVFHQTVSGRADPINFLPSGKGFVIALGQFIQAILDPNTFITNRGTTSIAWLILDKSSSGGLSSRIVGPVQLTGNSVTPIAFSGNSEWMYVGTDIQTPLGASPAGAPIFGFQTTLGETPPTGFNNVLLYSLSVQLETCKQ